MGRRPRRGPTPSTSASPGACAGGSPSARTVEDVGQPSSLPRLWNLEVALRPLRTDRLELALGAAHANADAWRRVVPRARLSVRVTDGLRFYAEGEAIPRVGADAFGGGSDSRLGLGLALDFDHVGGAVAGYLYDYPGAGANDGSVAARVHLNAWRTPPLAAPTTVVRVTLGGVDDDRAFVALVRRLRGLAADPSVTAVLFKIDDVQLGMGRIEELRDLIALLRARGKRTFAYATTPSTRDYYLAAAADAIVLHPAGELSLTGLVAERDLLQDGDGSDRRPRRSGPHRRLQGGDGAVRHERAVPRGARQQEPPARRRLRPHRRRDRRRPHPHRPPDGRGGGAERRRSRPLHAGRGPARRARRRGRRRQRARDLHRARARPPSASTSAIPIPRRSPPAPGRAGGWPSFWSTGPSSTGKSQNLPFDFGDFAGSETLVAALEECQRDATVSAVVLRVNSPGGSAFASDVVARALIRLRAAGKPVVVSMGDLAASGGYYIAAPADVVYAEPSTVTGSIGVFGFKVDTGDLMNLLGVNVETNRRGAHADYLSSARPWTEAETRMVTDKIRHIYGLFLDTVATGRRSRGLTVARVDELGRGQVWTGALAASLGLVDRLGGLSAAVDEAARLGRVPLGPDQLPELEVLPHAHGGLLRHLAGATGEAEADADTDASRPVTISPAALATPAGRAAVRLLAPLLLGGGSGVQARLPYDIDLR